MQLIVANPKNSIQTKPKQFCSALSETQNSFVPFHMLHACGSQWHQRSLSPTQSDSVTTI